MLFRVEKFENLHLHLIVAWQDNMLSVTFCPSNPNPTLSHTINFFPSPQDISGAMVIIRAHNITKDHSNRQHSLFTLLPSGRHYRSVTARAKQWWVVTSYIHSITFT